MIVMSQSASRDILIAWINHRLEAISETQHQLAVERVVLQEQATRLRLGTPAEEVELTLKRAGVRLPSAARHRPRTVRR